MSAVALRMGLVDCLEACYRAVIAHATTATLLFKDTANQRELFIHWSATALHLDRLLAQCLSLAGCSGRLFWASEVLLRAAMVDVPMRDGDLCLQRLRQRPSAVEELAFATQEVALSIARIQAAACPLRRMPEIPPFSTRNGLSERSFARFDVARVAVPAARWRRERPMEEIRQQSQREWQEQNQAKGQRLAPGSLLAQLALRSTMESIGSSSPAPDKPSAQGHAKGAGRDHHFSLSVGNTMHHDYHHTDVAEKSEEVPVLTLSEEDREVLDRVRASLLECCSSKWAWSAGRQTDMQGLTLDDPDCDGDCKLWTQPVDGELVPLIWDMREYLMSVERKFGQRMGETPREAFVGSNDQAFLQEHTHIHGLVETLTASAIEARARTRNNLGDVLDCSRKVLRNLLSLTVCRDTEDLLAQTCGPLTKALAWLSHQEAEDSLLEWSDWMALKSAVVMCQTDILLYGAMCEGVLLPEHATASAAADHVQAAIGKIRQISRSWRNRVSAQQRHQEAFLSAPLLSFHFKSLSGMDDPHAPGVTNPATEMKEKKRKELEEEEEEGTNIPPDVVLEGLQDRARHALKSFRFALQTGRLTQSLYWCREAHAVAAELLAPSLVLALAEAGLERMAMQCLSDCLCCWSEGTGRLWGRPFGAFPLPPAVSIPDPISLGIEAVQAKAAHGIALNHCMKEMLRMQLGAAVTDASQSLRSSVDWAQRSVDWEWLEERVEGRKAIHNADEVAVNMMDILMDESCARCDRARMLEEANLSGERRATFMDQRLRNGMVEGRLLSEEVTGSSILRSRSIGSLQDLQLRERDLLAQIYPQEAENGELAKYSDSLTLDEATLVEMDAAADSFWEMASFVLAWNQAGLHPLLSGVAEEAVTYGYRSVKQLLFACRYSMTLKRPAMAEVCRWRAERVSLALHGLELRLQWERSLRGWRRQSRWLEETMPPTDATTTSQSTSLQFWLNPWVAEVHALLEERTAHCNNVFALSMVGCSDYLLSGVPSAALAMETGARGRVIQLSSASMLIPSAIAGSIIELPTGKVVAKDVLGQETRQLEKWKLQLDLRLTSTVEEMERILYHQLRDCIVQAVLTAPQTAMDGIFGAQQPLDLWGGPATVIARLDDPLTVNGVKCPVLSVLAFKTQRAVVVWEPLANGRIPPAVSQLLTGDEQAIDIELFKSLELDTVPRIPIILPRNSNSNSDSDSDTGECATESGKHGGQIENALQDGTD